MPELIQKCIESQILMCQTFGYEHEVLTLESIRFKLGGSYLTEALNSSLPDGIKYCKATDYIRMIVLSFDGGIFLDADVFVQPGKNFNEMLMNEMFVGLEVADWANGKVVLGTSTIGAIPNHPMIDEWLTTVGRDFKGDTADCYESSMALLNTIGVKWQQRMKLYEPEYFYPKNSFTGELNITDKTISIHQFTKLWTPEKNKTSMIKELQHKIENGINFSFVKRGDGELACMNGDPGGNCDGHPYSKELGDKLREAYEYLKDKATIVEFADQQNYNILLHRTDSNLKEVSEFYKSIAASPRKKVFIGSAKVHDMAGILEAELVGIPSVNAFESYKSIYDRIPVVENAIYIFCAGMPAKVMIADLMKENPNATYLDCGSAFDPMAGQSRTFQITKEEFMSLYKPEPVIMPDNFSLPQATHPERLWAVSNIGTIEGKLVLDLGCGTNKTIPEAIGMDIRPVTDRLGNIDTLPFEDNSVDVIISKHSIEHVLDQVKLLKEWLRVLKPGGKMIIVLPDHGAIDTMDYLYSAGQHLHAYTRESFVNFLTISPDMCVVKVETVLDKWSFGVVAYKLPSVTVLIPQLGREDGLKKVIASIQQLNYPRHLLNVIILEGEETVPEKMVKGLAQSKGQVICFLANDTEATPTSLITAVLESLMLNKGLVAFNTGEPEHEGNRCEHFILQKSLIPEIGGQIFDTRYTHLGVDQLLWAKCAKLGQAVRSKAAIVAHNHFSTGKSEFDEVYAKVWNDEVMKKDRALLAEDLEKLNNE